MLKREKIQDPLMRVFVNFQIRQSTSRIELLWMYDSIAKAANHFGKSDNFHGLVARIRRSRTAVHSG